MRLYDGGAIHAPVFPWRSDIVPRCRFISSDPPIHLMSIEKSLSYVVDMIQKLICLERLQGNVTCCRLNSQLFWYSGIKKRSLKNNSPRNYIQREPYKLTAHVLPLYKLFHCSTFEFQCMF